MVSAASMVSAANDAVNSTASAAKVVAPPTSCSWQQVTENGKCAIEPRTCFDCLNTPLANGDRCTLTPTGLCASMAQYDAAQDYRRPGAASAIPIHYNYFPDTNTTYCAANDAACRLCRETTFAQADNNPSTYCIGANQCVCVRACELATWRNETLERLRNESTALKATCPVAANASTTFSDVGSSSNSKADASQSPTIAIAAVVKNAYASEDACRWYQNQTFCSVPRSCYDCLNVPSYSGEKCAINPLGFCSSMREYDYRFDYRERPAPTAAHYFPSTNATYCEPSDAKCATCRATAFKESVSGTVKPTQFCIGASGCVCVAFCESPKWRALVVDATCSTRVVTVEPEQFSIASIALMMMGFTLLFTICVQLLTMWRTRRHAHLVHQQREERLERLRQRVPRTGLQLQLEGWKSMCQDLISHEQQFLGDAHDGSNSAILTHGTGPSVIVEEGEGYRPLSPSYPAPPHSTETRAPASQAQSHRPSDERST